MEYNPGNLTKAVKNGEISVVKHWLANNDFEVNTIIDEKGATALMFAAVEGQIEIVRLLIKSGADVNIVKNENGFTALHAAVVAGHTQIVRLLIESDADADIVAKEEGFTALRLAISKGNEDIEQFLIPYTRQIDVIDKFGFSPIGYAAYYGQKTIVELLISQGSKCINNALIGASGGGNIEIVQFLVDHGADVNAAVKNGTTALIDSIIEGHIDVAKYLIAHGADINISKSDGITPLMVAAYKENFELVKLLIEDGADVSITDNSNKNALHFLLSSNSTKLNNISFPRTLNKDTKKIVKLFIKHGIPIKDETILLDAVQGGWVKMVLFLIKQGADPKKTDPQSIITKSIMGNVLKIFDPNSSVDVYRYQEEIVKSIKIVATSSGNLNEFMLLAVMLNDVKMVKYLIRQGANVNYMRDDEVTPLMMSFFPKQVLFEYIFEQTLVVDKILAKMKKPIEGENNFLKRALVKVFTANDNSLKIAKILFNYGAEEDETLWMLAVIQNDISKIKYLIRRADTKKLTEYMKNLIVIHSNILTESIRRSKQSIVVKEVMGGVLFDTPSEDIYSPIIQMLYDAGLGTNKSGIELLIVAIVLEDTAMVKMIMEHNPNLNLNNKNDKGFRVVDYVYAVKNAEIRTILIQRGADVSQLKTDKESLRKLKKEFNEIRSEKNELVNIVSNLSMNGNIMDMVKVGSWLSSALKSKKNKDLKKAIRNGAALKSIQAIDLISDDHSAKFIRLAFQNGVNKDQKDNEGKTPLMYACHLGRTKVVETLIRLGARPDVVDNNGYDAWHYASLSGKKKILSLLNNHEKLSESEHQPEQLIKILSNFTHDTPMKYTTHGWDFGDQYGEYKAFIEAVRDQWSSFESRLKDLSNNLHKKIELFLFTVEPPMSWCSTGDVRLGWSSTEGLPEWCDAYKDPWDFPIDPSDHPGSDAVYTFGDVIRLFKQEIEIRSDNNMLEDIVLQFQKEFGRAYTFDLIKLKGRNFYTDVEQFRNTLKRIFMAIKDRSEHDTDKHIRIEVVELDEEMIELCITHIGSHADRSANEMNKQIKKGDFKIIKESLKNLCFWSIEDQYDGQGYRVNYLKKIEETEIKVLKKLPDGFTHVMRFYKK